MERVTRAPRGADPMDGPRTGQCRHPIRSNTVETSILNTLAQATAADPMHVQGSMDGHATETTLQTSAPARGKPEPSWTPELIAA